MISYTMVYGNETLLFEIQERSHGLYSDNLFRRVNTVLKINSVS